MKRLFRGKKKEPPAGEPSGEAGEKKEKQPEPPAYVSLPIAAAEDGSASSVPRMPRKNRSSLSGDATFSSSSGGGGGGGGGGSATASSSSSSSSAAIEDSYTSFPFVSEGSKQQLKDPDVEHVRMCKMLREFPVAYEKYMREYNAKRALESAKPQVMISETGDVTVMCGNSAPESANGNLWSIISSVFCFAGSDAYNPYDEAATNDVLAGIPGDPLRAAGRGGKKVKKEKAPKLRPEAVLQTIPTDWDNKTTAGVHLIEESRRLFKIFCGITRSEGLTFDWQHRVTKGRVTVHSASVPNSSWQAIKSDCKIKADKYAICKLITDDARSHEYDEGVESYEILDNVDERSIIRRYIFKAVWPTAPREFVMITTWTELEDGCIMVSTLSPPDEYHPQAPNSPNIRAYLSSSGALLRPIEERHGGGVHVTFVTHCDLGGSIPAWLTNNLGSGAPVKSLSKVCEICEREHTRK